MLIVTGSITARGEDVLEPLLAAAQAHVERSRAEPGCIEHGCALDADNPLRIVFFERWADMAALEAHFAQPGVQELLAAVRVYAASAEPITIYEAVKVERQA